MEPRQFREPEPAKPRPATPSPPQAKFAAKHIADLGSGPSLRLFNPSDKPAAMSDAMPPHAVRLADWAGIAARTTNEDVKYHADI
jgi:hypothetical protein